MVMAGKHEAAVATAESLLDSPELMPYACELLAICFRAQGKLEEAQAQLRKAVATNSKVASFHLNLGNVLQDMGRIDASISSYRRALRLFPGYAEAQNDLGTAYYQKGWVDEAMDCYRKSIKLNPRHGIAHANLASALRKAFRLKEARTHLMAELACRSKAGMRTISDTVLGWFLRAIPGRSGSMEQRLYCLARSRLASGDATLAERICDEVLANGRARCEALQLKLEILRDRREFPLLVEVAGNFGDTCRQRPGIRLVEAEALVALGRVDEAEAKYRQLIGIRAADAKARIGLGRLLLDAGNSDEALKVLEPLAGRDATSPEGWCLLGRAQRDARDYSSAESSLRRALELEPEHFGSLKTLGGLLRRRNALLEAEQCFRRAISQRSEDMDVRLRLGRVLLEQGRPDDAIAVWAEALQVDPGDWRPYNDIGTVFLLASRRDEARKYFEQSLERNPDSVEVLLNLARMNMETGDVVPMREFVDRAKAIAPGDVRVINAEGSAHIEQFGRDGLAEAEKIFRRVLSISPDYAPASMNLGGVLLQMGALAEGWTRYEARRELPEFGRAHAQVPLPDWQGRESGEKAVLVYQEQGIGDEMMYASCLEDLRKDVPYVTLLCSKKLEVLLGRSFPEIRTMGVDMPDIPGIVRSLDRGPRVKVAIGSLPRHYRKSLDDFPPHKGYLRPDAGKTARWKQALEALGAGKKVGLAWTGGFTWTGGMQRSMTLEMLKPLLAVPGCRFISLEYKDCQPEIAEFAAKHGMRVEWWREAIDDYDETAALVAALDEVVSVCTAVVHLGGALGRPVHVLAPFRPAWRYNMVEGGMPWYPSVRVYRQHSRGDWAPVVAEIARELVS